MKSLALHVLAALLALVFVATGSLKLAGTEALVQSFAGWGFPAWFVYVVGGVEVVGAVLVAVPAAGTRFAGALLLAFTMIGATLVHLVSDGLGPAVPALGLLVLLLVQLYANRRALRWMIRRRRHDEPQPQAG